MASPHPGSWRTVTKTDPNNPQHIKNVVDTELSAAHACLICTNLNGQVWKVLYPNAYGNAVVTTRIWDPGNPQNPISTQIIPNWPIGGSAPPCLFCGGHAFMADGKLLMVGGIRPDSQNFPQEPPHLPAHANHGLNYAYIFDPNPPIPGQEWKVAGGVLTPHAMGDDRFYPTLTQLGEIPFGSPVGRLVVMSGWIDGGSLTFAKKPQYYDETDGWHYFPNPEQSEQPFSAAYDYYPSAHVIPYGSNAGKIFYSVPMEQARVFNPFWDGTTLGGYWQALGTQRSLYRVNSTSTLLPLIPPYDSAKVLIVGGAANYLETTYPYNSAEIIDIATADANTPWTVMNDLLFFARKNHLSVILPDDMLFVVGGNLRAFVLDPVTTPELIDTTQANFQSTLLPAHVYPRVHHTTALLLPDATVWLGGSGMESEDSIYHIEIYEPGYLFEGQRPAITSPLTNISYGDSFTIQTSHEIEAIRLISMAAVTHSTDMNQRSVGLQFFSGGGINTYEVNSPPDRNIAPPGLYMLFVLRPKSASLSQESMIPSVAKIVKLS